MAARHQQADKRELRHTAVVLLLDKMREDMSLKVVDLDERDRERLGETLGKRDTHHKRAEKPRPTGEGHSINLLFSDSRVANGGIHHRHDILLMGARGQLRHHAAVLLMHLLRCNHVGQDTVAPQQGCGGIVARRFNSEYSWYVHLLK